MTKYYLRKTKLDRSVVSLFLFFLSRIVLTGRDS